MFSPFEKLSNSYRLQRTFNPFYENLPSEFVTTNLTLPALRAERNAHKPSSGVCLQKRGCRLGGDRRKEMRRAAGSTVEWLAD